MANTAAGSVDIISRLNGKQITRVAGGNQIVALNEPSVVRIHAATDSVIRYERQGNDLILHMKDGSTVRYQHFFQTDAEGHYSELVFDDGEHQPVHAVFPMALLTAGGETVALVPEFAAINGLSSLVLSEGIASNAVLAGVLGFLAIGAGIGIAAGSSSGGGGNPNTPTLTVNPLTGDNRLNANEVHASQVLSGETTFISAGQTVTLILNGVTYTTTVGADGKWSFNLPASVLEGLQDGSYSVIVKVTTPGGQTLEKDFTLTVDTVAPTLTVSPLAGDGILDGAELTQPLVVNGTASAGDAGQTVTVGFNGQTYTTTVGSDGSWSVTIPPSALTGISEGAHPVTVTVSDAAGNTTTVTQPLTVAGNPSLTIGDFAVNNILDGAEQQLNQTISGSTKGIATGQAVTVTLNGKTYTATVDANGNWNLSVPAADLALLMNGNSTINASVNDPEGRQVTGSHDFMVNNNFSAIAISPVSGDGLINATEAQSDITVSGSTSNVAAGTQLTLTLNGKTYTATVGLNGSWSAQIPRADLALLADGNITLTVSGTDAAGNPVSGSQQLGVYIHDLPSASLSLPFGDGSLNGVDVQGNQTLSGSTGVNGAGQTVSVTLGGITYPAVVAVDGSWSVSIPTSTLQGLGQGSQPISVTVSDFAGNTNTQVTPVLVDTLAPTLTISPIAGDGTINAIEAALPVAVSGTSSEVGSTITVSFNGGSYTGVVQNDGTWSVNIPASAFVGLPDGPVLVSVTVTDAAGNTTTANKTVIMDAAPANLPTLDIHNFAGDNVLDGAEQKVNQTISGSTTHIEQGQVVTVTLNGKTYTATVDVLGNWSTQVPAADLALLANGTATINAQVGDVSGNLAFKSEIINVDSTKGGLAINTIAGDNLLNIDEASASINITGTSANVAVGTLLQVTVGGVPYFATVQAGGIWSVTIPSVSLFALPEGSNPVTVSGVDLGGNLVSSTLDLGVFTHNPPTISVDPLFIDNRLNAAEVAVNQTITGSTGLLGPGQTVAVTFGGVTYQGNVAVDGSWSIMLPSAALQALGQGLLPFNILVKDIAGNEGFFATNILVDTVAPTLAVNPVAGDGIINLAEATATVVISGTSSEMGAQISATLNGKTYFATVMINGTWQFDVPPADLVGLAQGNYSLSVIVKDGVGNTTTVSKNLTIDADPANLPTLTINTFAGNNILDGAEQQVTQSISGVTTGIEAGKSVTVTLNGKSYTAIVAGDGSWSTQVPSADLVLLANGSATITASASDAAGNPAVGSENITVNNQLAGLSINPVTGDNLINVAEAASNITVSGASTNVNVGQTVTLTLNGKIYTATIGAGGIWSAQIPAADLALLADGTITLTASATDAGGNPVSGSVDLGIYIHNLPVASVGPLFGDGVLNIAEAAVNQTITGSTGINGVGQKVSITVGGGTYIGIVAADGSWSVTLPSAALQGLNQGGQPLIVTVSDAAGNTSSLSTPITVDTQAPLLTLAPIAGDNIINNPEAQGIITLNGTSSELGATVFVTINGQTYSVVVQPSGNWSLSLPAGALSGLSDGNYAFTVKVTDAAGNPTTVTQNVVVDADPAHLPTLSIHVFAGNNIVDGAEQQATQIISGVSTGLEAGRIVTLTLNGKTYTATVGSDGNWNTQIPAADLVLLSNSQFTITASAMDTSGNPATGSQSITVDNTASGLSISPLTGDNLINVGEAQAGVTVNGTSSNVNVGQSVVITLNGKIYTATVQPNGSWSTTIPTVDLVLLADGNITLFATATDATGHSVSSSADLGIYLHKLPNPQINTPFGNGTLDASEAAVTQTITGTTDVSGLGQTVTVTIAGVNYQAQVGTNGQWALNLPSSVLQGIGQGAQTIDVTATDAAGNFTSHSFPISVDTVPPTLNVGNISTDNVVNALEATAIVPISGTTSESGATVSVTINGITYTSLANGLGVWTVNIPANIFNKLPDGIYPVRVSVTDVAGNTTVDTPNIKLVTQGVPAPFLNTPFGDGYLNAAEAGTSQTLTGSTGVSGSGQSVTVNVGGTPHLVSVDSSGNWQLVLQSSELLALPNSNVAIVVTATDSYGNNVVLNDSAVVDKLAPTLNIAPITGDNIINAAEELAPLVVTGTTDVSEAGRTISVVLNGVTYTGLVLSDGSWSVSLSNSAVQALADGNYTLTVSLQDLAGNQTSVDRVITIDANPANLPTITIGAISGDNYISRAESTQDVLISGVTERVEQGRQVTVVLNGKSYFGTVQLNGSWSVTVPAADATLLPEGPLTAQANVSDVANNPASDVHQVTVIASLADQPSLAVGTVAGNDIIDLQESNSPLIISGTSQRVPANQTVTVTLNSKTYTAQVQADGSWQVSVPSADVKNLPQGSNTIGATVNDAAQNPANATHNVSVDTQAPLLVVDVDTSINGVLNLADALLGLVVHGTCIGDSGLQVTVTVAGKPYQATVQNDGTWTLTIPTADLLLLGDGPLVGGIDVSVTDAAGNKSEQVVDLTVAVHQLPTLTFDPLFTDGILNHAEAAINTTLTGVSSGLAVGTPVTLTLNGVGYQGSVTSLGVWQVDVNASVLTGLADGTLQVSVSATDPTTGNPANGSVSLDVLTHNIPNVTFPTLPFGDGFISKVDSGLTQLLTGQTGATGAGQTVSVNINGVDYLANVALNGTWTLSVPSLSLAGLTDGSHTITVTATDRAQNVSVESVDFTSIINGMPAPTISSVSFGTELNATEALSPALLTGTVGSLGTFGNVQGVTVFINGFGYSAILPNPQDGTWSLSVPSAILQALPDGSWPIQVVTTDAAGNTGSVSGSVDVLIHGLPSPTVNLPFGDGILTQAEGTLTQNLTGTTGALGAGQTVTVVIDSLPGLTFSVAANADGTWSLPLRSSVLQSLAGGSHTFSVSVTDRAGNEATITPLPFLSQQQLPLPTIDILSFGTSLNASEASGLIIIRGTTGLSGLGQNVSLKIDIAGVSYPGIVDSVGGWSVSIPAGALGGLPNGSHSINVTATDSVGNSGSISTLFDSYVVLPVPTINTPSFGDYLSANESNAEVTFTGNSGTLGAGQSVKFYINGSEFTATVDPLTGSWTVPVSSPNLQPLLLVDGVQTMKVVVTDAGGNVVNTTQEFTSVIHNLPTITVGAYSFGSELDFSESHINQTISGTTTNIGIGQQITVNVGSLDPLTATVGVGGIWSLTLTPAQMTAASLGASPVHVATSYTDVAGNPSAGTVLPDFTLNLTPPAVNLTINAVTGDNIINVADNLSGLPGGLITISGTVTGANPLLQTVKVFINNTPISVSLPITGNTWTTQVLASFFNNNATNTVEAMLDGIGSPASATVSVIRDTTAPTLTLADFTGDNILTLAESQSSKTISGTASLDVVGQVVTVTLGAKTYFAEVLAGGAWSVTVSPTDLQALAQGNITLSASVKDSVGNVGSVSEIIVVDTVAPLILLDVGTNLLNNLGGVLSGTATGAEGKTLTITLGSNPANVINVVVGSDGKWTANIDPSNLVGLINGPLVADITVTDGVGNTADTHVTLSVALNDTLALVVDPLFNGGYLNAAGSLVSQVISGVATGAGLGSKVSLTIGGVTLEATVGSNGKWSLTIPSAQLGNLSDGLVQLDLVLTDANGNTTNKVVDLNVLSHLLPSFGTSSPVFGLDGILSAAEALTTQTLSGVINNVAPGALVTVAVGSTLLYTTVGAGGAWSINLLPALLGGLQDGSLQIGISVKDVAGNIVNSALNLNVLTHNLPSITLNPIFGDGILNLAEVSLGQVISGVTKNLPVGSTVNIMFGSTPLSAIVGADGTFSVPVPGGVLSALTNGTVNVTANAIDAAGNPTSSTGVLNVSVTLPQITLPVLFGDGALSLADTAVAQLISGTVSGVATGTQVKVSLGGKDFFGVTAANGSFNMTLQPADLKALADGNLSAVVSVTDAAGNTGTASGPLNVIINNVPKLILNPIFGDGLLSQADSLLPQIISGQVVNGVVGSQVQVTVGATTLYATVGTDGIWSLPVLPGILSGLLDGTQNISVSLTDSVGNTSSASGSVKVQIHALPTLTVQPIFGDGVLSVADLLMAQTISGTSTNVAVGTQISVTLNGKTYLTTVGTGGGWSVVVPPLDLKAILTDGSISVNASLTDAVGNPATVSGLLNVISNALPSLTLDPIFGNGLLNAAEAALTQTISGQTTNAVGSTVNLTVGGLHFSTTVGANGSWSIAIPPTSLSQLLDGPIGVSANVVNAAGNSAGAAVNVTVGIHNLPTLSLGTFFGTDNYLNAAEALAAQVISGTSTHAAGGTVTVTVGGATLTASVNQDGTWSVPITPSALTGLLDGTASIGVTLTDTVGNSISNTSSFTVKTHALPLLGVNPVTSLFGILLNGLVVSGSSKNVSPPAQVSVTLLGQTLQGDIAPDGKWSVKFTGSILNLLNLGNLLTTLVNVAVTDEAGNHKELTVGLGVGSLLPISLLAESETQVTSFMLASDTDTSDTTTSDQHQTAAISGESSDTGLHTAVAANTVQAESTLVEPLAQPIDSILTTDVTEGGYTIGGVTLNLADGTVLNGESLIGSAENDEFILNTMDFTHIDGGLGTDTLLLGGLHQVLDLTSLGLKVEHIEVIDLGTSGTNSIVLNLHDALTITDKPQDDLLIKGAEGGQVTLSNTEGGVWSSVSQRTVDGQTFDVYHNSSLDSGNTLGDVLVQHGLQVHLV
ncbi:Ig-like domain-containing protein [Yersinia nurmii]|uniref:Ig-like domain-containing protein n=1 Tax=Yersinia nurmii TaxID=685706 RepID=A0AAW7K435_9GAMM|nr:Ig-like domain-containing protein [Yersinia nurmii]MDN0087059.1 Ig-like domain-containing protein [Yersinia nurmii]